jgi:hypothetical protein
VENTEDGPKVPAVEDGEFEIDVAKVSHAVREPFPTGVTLGILVTGSHSTVKGPVSHRRPFPILLIQVLGNDPEMTLSCRLLRTPNREVNRDPAKVKCVFL